MPKATDTFTTTPLPLTSGKNAIALSATIDRLKQIAAESGDRLYLSDGPVNPDYELLDICAEGLRLAREARHFNGIWRAEINKPQLEQALDTSELFRLWQKAEAEMRGFCTKARKLSAKTPAGLFAKAMLCRAHKTGAGVLAMSLADDFLACDEIRLAIWKPEVRS